MLTLVGKPMSRQRWIRPTARYLIYRCGHVASVLVDTDVLAAHLRGERRYDPGQDEVYVSAITQAELTGARGSNGGQVGLLLSAVTTIEIDSGIAERAGHIARAGGVTLADALIAATAIERDMTLV